MRPHCHRLIQLACLLAPLLVVPVSPALAQNFAGNKRQGPATSMRVIEAAPARTPYFVVVGAVRFPGVFTTQAPSMSLGRLIEEAGGLRPDASPMIRIIHNGAPRVQIRFDPSQPRPDDLIYQGDVVVVSTLPNLDGPPSEALATIPVACIGLMDRPVVLTPPPSIDTVDALIARLPQRRQLAAHVRVVDPYGRTATRDLVAGTVLIFDPQQVDRTILVSNTFPEVFNLDAPAPAVTPEPEAVPLAKYLQEKPEPTQPAAAPITEPIRVEPAPVELPPVAPLPRSIEVTAARLPIVIPDLPLPPLEPVQTATAAPVELPAPYEPAATPAVPVLVQTAMAPPAAVQPPPVEARVIEIPPRQTVEHVVPQYPHRAELDREAPNRMALLLGAASSIETAPVRSEPAPLERYNPVASIWKESPPQLAAVPTTPILEKQVGAKSSKLAAKTKSMNLLPIVGGLIALFSCVTLAFLAGIRLRETQPLTTSIPEPEPAVETPAPLSASNAMQQLLGRTLPVVEELPTPSHQMPLHGTAVGHRRMVLHSAHEPVEAPHFARAPAQQRQTMAARPSAVSERQLRESLREACRPTEQRKPSFVEEPGPEVAAHSPAIPPAPPVVPEPPPEPAPLAAVDLGVDIFDIVQPVSQKPPGERHGTLDRALRTLASEKRG